MSILEKVDKLPHVKTWPGNIPITSRYSAGLAGEKFLRAIKEKEQIVGTHCSDCDITYVPATIFCERCFRQIDDNWVEVDSCGFVYTYTILYKDLDENDLETPIILAYVRLDGCDGGIVHYLREVAFEEIYIGMPVEAVFKPAAERQGSILDISHFKPAQ
jgi:hypothetical protein